MLSTKQPIYNLLTEPWIQCVINGRIENVGLLDFNRSINQITKIIIPKIANNDFPFYELAFYRFIYVLYSRAINADMYDERDAQEGITEREIQLVEKYLLHYKNKFDIMDPNNPFMQCSKSETQTILPDVIPNSTSFVTSFIHLPSENAINTKSLIGYSAQNKISCNNSKEFIRILSEESSLSPRETVYHLLYLNSFAKCAGVAGCSAVSSTPELYVMFQGKTVGQTIQMNIIANAAEQTAPIWERDGILSYYNMIEQVDTIGYTFYPNRFCRFEYNDDLTSHNLLYAPHNFETLNDTSKNICKSVCEQYYQSCDRDALLKLKDGKIATLKYNRTENWLTMLMSAVINAGDEVESSNAGKEIFGGNVNLPHTINIVLYGRSADGKSGVYQYAEKIEESVDSEIFKNALKRAYVEKYIRFVRAQFVINKKIIDKYYKLLQKVNPHSENKVPFINQQVSLYAHQKLYDLYNVLSQDTNIDENVEAIFKNIRIYTKDVIMKMLSENILCAAQAYNSIVFGGKK